MKRKFLFIFILFIALSANVFFQQKQKPDLSGVWIIDKKNSDTSETFPDDSLSMIIEHNGPQLKFIREIKVSGKIRRNEKIFYTDKRNKTEEFIENSDGETVKTKTKTYWNKDNLIIKTAVIRKGKKKNLGVTRTRQDITEKYSLSENKNILTLLINTRVEQSWRNGIINEMSIPSIIEKLVFIRKSD